MTILSYNPYHEINWSTINQYKAQLHCHTTESDGSFAPYEVVDMYHSAGYDILQITDHDFGYSSLNPSPTYPWQTFGDGGRAPSVLGMIAIQGNEPSVYNHIISFNNDFSDAYTDERDCIQKIQSNGGFSWMAHPAWYGRGASWYATTKKLFPSLMGLEIFNPFNDSAVNESLWDNILSILMPETPFFGFAVDDMHNINHFEHAYQNVLSSDLTLQETASAIENGQTMMVRGKETPSIQSIEVDEEASTITINATDYQSIQWVSEGINLHTGNVFHYDAFESSYIRARVVASPDNLILLQPFGFLVNIAPERPAQKKTEKTFPILKPSFVPVLR